jgi:hypothetical protein
VIVKKSLLVVEVLDDDKVLGAKEKGVEEEPIVEGVSTE